MKNVFKTMLVVAVAGTLLLDSCKKGENDPFLSLKSRKARVVGEWTVTAASITDINDSGSSSTTTNTTYDGTTETTTVGSNSSTRTVTYTYTFVKDGTFTSVETETGTVLSTPYTDVTTTQGNWNFTGRIGKDEKNKESIVLYTTSMKNDFTMSGNTTTSTSSYTGTSRGNMVFRLDRLSNKEMIVLISGTDTDNAGDVDSSEGTMTMTQ